MAGSRPTGDPLAMAAGVAHKALAPVAGVPMLVRVVRTLRSAHWVNRIVICGLEPDWLASQSALAEALDLAHLEVIRGGATPGASAAHAISTLGLQPPVLITTGDHPLLTAATVDDFCSRSAATDADVTFGFVSGSLVESTFPGIRRTHYKFRDGGFCGCNLFALRTSAGGSAPEAWMQVERHRKQPWRLVGMLGVGVLIRFVLGQLSVSDMTRRVGVRLGLKASPILLSDPAAGFDVDRPEQLTAAEAFLRKREG